MTEEARAYLISRGFTPETWEAWGLYSKKGDSPALVFPYRKNGQLVNLKYRHRDGAPGKPWKNFSQEKDAERTLWGLDRVEGQALIITEGELDAMSLWQWGFKNVVSVPSGAEDHHWIENEWDRLQRFTTIYIAYDNDEAGERGADAVARRLGVWRCFRVRLPQKDANQCLMLGTPVTEVEAALHDAQDYRPPVLVSAAQFEEAVSLHLENHDKPEGARMGFPYIDRLLCGFRPGELTVWTGRNGSGKSTVLFQVAQAFVWSGYRVCIASFEMVPKNYLAWMVRQSLHDRGFESNYRAHLFQEWARRLYVIDQHGAIEPDTLLDALDYAARRFGVTVFIVDSLMMVKVPLREKFDAQVELVRRLKDFAKAENVHVHLVAHPRKGERDTQEPDKTAVRGASEVTDIADNVLVIHREHNSDAEGAGDTTKLALLKNRMHGELGWVRLEFHPGWKLFRERGQPWPNWLDIESRTGDEGGY